MLFSGKTILIVDDEPLLRECLKFILESRGAVVLEAENGFLGLEVLKNFNVDLIISDIRMPECDGVTLAREISTRPDPRPKVFLYSGYSDVTKEEALKLGVIDILPKPFDVQAMLKAFSEALSIA